MNRLPESIANFPIEPSPELCHAFDTYVSLSSRQRRRLSDLAEHLDFLQKAFSSKTDPLEADLQFDMGLWCTSWINSSGECRTAACAAGYAAMNSDFNREGLYLVKIRRTWMPEEDQSVPAYIDETMDEPVYGFRAMRMFFGTARPFNPAVYSQRPTPPSAVANLIREILAARPAPAQENEFSSEESWRDRPSLL